MSSDGFPLVHDRLRECRGATHLWKGGKTKDEWKKEVSSSVTLTMGTTRRNVEDNPQNKKAEKRFTSVEGQSSNKIFMVTL